VKSDGETVVHVSFISWIQSKLFHTVRMYIVCISYPTILIVNGRWPIFRHQAKNVNKDKVSKSPESNSIYVEDLIVKLLGESLEQGGSVVNLITN